MSSLKTTVSIEGELVDLAEVFKALAVAAAATPRSEPRVSGGPLAYNPSELTIAKEFLKADTSEPRTAYEDSGRKPVLSSSENEGSTDEPETQEQSEQTGKRKRRTKAEIEADRLAAEQPIKGDEEAMRSHTENLEKATAAADAIENWNIGQPKDDVATADEAAAAFEAQVASLNDTPVPEVNMASAIADVKRAEENPTKDLSAAPQPNTTSATVDGTSPFIAELRAFCQQKMLGKPENQVLIKNLLTEFGAAGLSALKEVDKMAFKQRLEALPFK